MISRVADGCFWLGRYLERAESMARLLATSRTLALDGELAPEQVWSSVVVVAEELEDFVARHGPGAEADGELVQSTMTWDPETGTSIHWSTRAARDNARNVREVLSGDVWEAVNELWLWLDGAGARAEYEESREAFYRRVRDEVQLALGLMRSTMLHDEPLDVAWLGLLLERVNQTARILDVHHHAFLRLPADHNAVVTGLWVSLLHAVSGFESYLRAHAGVVSGDQVARFLVLDDRFPRSVRYGVSAALDRLSSLRLPVPGAGTARHRELPGKEAQERLAALDGWVRSLDDVAAGDVHSVLVRVVDETTSVCDAVGRELLGYADGG